VIGSRCIRLLHPRSDPLNSLNSLVNRLVRMLNNYERYVIGSGLSPSLETYVRRSIKVTLIACSISLVLYALTALALGFKLINAIIDLIMLLAILIPLAFFLSTTLIPKLLFLNRGFKLEAKYYRLLFFLSLFLTSGLGVTKSLLKLTQLRDELKDFSIELDIIEDRLMLGYDFNEVISYVASITPCKSLSNLLLSIIGIERSGYSTLPVMTNLANNYFTLLKARMEEAINYLGMLTEAFIAIALIFPLIISIITSSTLLVPVGGLDPYALMLMTLLVIMPTSLFIYYVVIDYILSGVTI